MTSPAHTGMPLPATPAGPAGYTAAMNAAQPLDRLLPEIRRSHPGQFLDAEPGASESGVAGVCCIAS